MCSHSSVQGYAHSCRILPEAAGATDAMAEALWRVARLAIWHPMGMDNCGRAHRLYREVKRAVAAVGNNAKKSGWGVRLLAAELHDESVRGVGNGMCLVDPAYGINQELQERLLPDLGRSLAGGWGGRGSGDEE